MAHVSMTSETKIWGNNWVSANLSYFKLKNKVSKVEL